MNGIYTLANDVVYDQLVALVNSIEANAGREMPVCVIAYNDNLDKVRSFVESRPNVTLFDDKTVFAEWEDFSFRLWQTHPTALGDWKRENVTTKFYRVGENHRYCAFDTSAPFDRFIYMDADTLLMQPVDFIFDRLEQADVVTYDFQYKDPTHIYNVASPKLLETFSQEEIESKIFCSGFYASKCGLITAEQREWIIGELQKGEAEILYRQAPNQSVLNYMIMKLSLPVCNFAHVLPVGKSTGNSVTSPHFQERDHVLYDGENRLTFLHYIGISSRYFRQLCQGENIDFPYRDLFLYYRYLHEPDNRPHLVGQSKNYKARPSFFKRALQRLKVF